MDKLDHTSYVQKRGLQGNWSSLITHRRAWSRGQPAWSWWPENSSLQPWSQATLLKSNFFSIERTLYPSH